MYKLEVTANKLNIRNSPFADPSFSNWVGEMNKGEVFNAVRLVKGALYEGSDDWYADDGGGGSKFIAASQVKKIPLSLDNDLSKKIILNNPLDSTGTGIIIGILDTGFDIESPSIRAAYLSSDDFLTQVHNIDITNNHGTKVAGIIAGNTDKITGCAIDVRLRSFRTNDNDGNTDDKAVVDALNHIVSANTSVDILNLSLDITNTVKEEVQACVNILVERGVIIVVAGFSQLFGDISNLAAIKGTFPVGIIEADDFTEVKKNGIHQAYECAFLNNSITTLGLSNSPDPLSSFKSSSAYTALTTGIIAKFLSSKNIPPNTRIAEVKKFLSGNSFDIKAETAIVPFKPYKNEKI